MESKVKKNLCNWTRNMLLSHPYLLLLSEEIFVYLEM